jgi:hypothetical protein
MRAWESPGEAAVRALVEDRDMLAAGAAEMAQALPKGARGSYARTLAGTVWRAMLTRAR